MKTLYQICDGGGGDMLTAGLLELMPDKEAALAKLECHGNPGVVFEAEPSAKVRHHRHAYAGVDSWRGGRRCAMWAYASITMTMRMSTTTNMNITRMHMRMSMCRKTRIAMTATRTTTHTITSMMRITMRIMAWRSAG